jgi:predicted transcriptional regulator
MTGRTRTEEVAMSNPDRSVKTLAIRLDEGLHARLTVVAQLGEVTVTEAIRQAIEAYVDVQRSQGDLAAKAAGALEEIERDATTRRSAIQALFGEAGEAASAAPAVEASKSRGRKPTDRSGDVPS